MRFFLIIALISMPAVAGIGEYLGRVGLKKQVNRLLLVEVDQISHSLMRMLHFNYEQALSPYEHAQAQVYRYSIHLALLDNDLLEVQHLLNKLMKLGDGSLVLTAGKDEIDSTDRNGAAIELIRYSKKALADIDVITLDYERDPLKFVRLKRLLEDYGNTAKHLDSRHYERVRTRKTISNDLRTALHELSQRETADMRTIKAHVRVVSPPLSSEWPSMIPIGLELVANIFMLSAASSPDEQALRNATERMQQVIHLSAGADSITLKIANASGEKVLESDFSTEYLDEIVDHYLER